MPTVGDVVKDECLKAGVTIQDDQVEHVLWTGTGYPCFWPDAAKTPEENLRMQVREWAEKHASKPELKSMTVAEFAATALPPRRKT